MGAADAVYARFRDLCLSFPDTAEVEAWGHPTFRVGGKIFASLGEEKGRLGIGFKATLPEQALLVTDPRFRVAAYVGRHGWVTLDAEGKVDWKELRRLVARSHALISGGAEVRAAGAPTGQGRKRRGAAASGTRPKGGPRPGR